MRSGPKQQFYDGYYTTVTDTTIPYLKVLKIHNAEINPTPRCILLISLNMVYLFTCVTSNFKAIQKNITVTDTNVIMDISQHQPTFLDLYTLGLFIFVSVLQETFFYSQKLVKYEHRSPDGVSDLVEVHDFHAGIIIIIINVTMT